MIVAARIEDRIWTLCICCSKVSRQSTRANCDSRMCHCAEKDLNLNAWIYCRRDFMVHRPWIQYDLFLSSSTHQLNSAFLCLASPERRKTYNMQISYLNTNEWKKEVVHLNIFCRLFNSSRGNMPYHIIWQDFCYSHKKWRVEPEITSLILKIMILSKF